MHSTDYASRTRKRHVCGKLVRIDDNLQRCNVCMQLYGVMSSEAYFNMLYPPGVSPGVAKGKPPMQAPRLPANWRGK